jgi:ABC-2 type transport system permease protein
VCARRGSPSASEHRTPGAPKASPTLGRVQSLLAKRRGLAALTGREILRVLKLWTQTVGAPVVSSFLFIVVFGLSLGDRITSIDGVEYEVFIVPGLITMAMVQAAYANNSASVFQAKFDRYLNDILSAPMRAWEVNLGLSLGGVVRALLIGVSLLVLSLVVVDVPVREPGVLLLAVALALLLFSALGVVVGIYAESWDHTAFVNNLVILPLTFLGGVFYSVDVLPSPWEELSHVNPIFYLVQAVRYGFLGTSDVSVGLALAVTAVLAAACVAWSTWLFATGRKIKP